MSTIATMVKAALALEQKVQAAIHKGAHGLATRAFNKAGTIEALALVDAEDAALKLERLRAQKAANLIAQHKAALIRLHSGFDAELELVDGRKSQQLSAAAQARNAAASWQSTAIRADLAAEAARKASAQL